VRLMKWFSPHTLTVVGLLLVSAGFGMILLFRHDLTVVAVVVSFIVLELGVGISQTITNDTIVASVPAAKSGAASAVSETAYELGAVVGTATLGTIFTAFYRANVEVPQGLSPTDAAHAAESIGGATSVAQHVPAGVAERLLDSARTAFDSGIAPTATIAALLTLFAAAVVFMALRNVSDGEGRSTSARPRRRRSRSGRGSTPSTSTGRPATPVRRRRPTDRPDRRRRDDCSAGR